MSWYVGEELIDFLEMLLDNARPAQDPYLVQASDDQRALPRAGLLAHRAQALARAGDTAGADRVFDRFRAIWEHEALWPE